MVVEADTAVSVAAKMAAPRGAVMALDLVADSAGDVVAEAGLGS